MGDGSPCPEGSSVIHSLTAKRTLSRFEFVALTEGDVADVAPTRVLEKLSEDFEEEPLVSSIGPDGLWHTLHKNGLVTTVDPDLKVSEAFTVEIPAGFSLSISMVVDEFGGVIVGVTYPRQIDGSAGRFLRYARDSDSEWQQTYTEKIAESIERFWGRDAEIFAALRRPDNVEEGPEFTLARFGGVQAVRWSRAWTRPIAWPVVEVVARDSALYVAAAPNRTRTASQSAGSDIDWTPRELASAGNRLYSWHSAIRLQAVQGLAPNSKVTVWESGAADENDFYDVTDETARSLIDIDGGSVPRIQIDGEAGPEVRLDVLSPTPPQYLRSRFHLDEREKENSSEVADWQRALLPSMRDAGSDGARWAFTGLVRIENAEAGEVLFTDWKCIFQQGDFSLEYRGEDDVEIRWRVPGSTQPTGTTTLTGPAHYVCFTMVYNGAGIAGSYLRLNGVEVHNLTISEPVAAITRSSLGWTPSTARPAVRMFGGLKEFVTYLGTDSTGVHDASPTLDEVQRVEGYACNAYGVQAILSLAGHPYNNGPPVGAGSSGGGLDFEDAFAVPDGLTVKLDRGDGSVRWLHSGPDAGAGVAVDSEDGVYTIGTPLDLTTANPDRLSKLRDDGDESTVLWSVKGGALGSDTLWRAGAVRMHVDQCDALYVPWSSIGDVPAAELRKYLPDGSEVWTLEMPDPPTYVGAGGLFVDDAFRGGPCANEFVYVTCRSTQTVKRVEVLGRRDTGELRERETEELAICQSGVVSRLVDGAWVEQANDFTPGGRPWSFEFFGNIFLGGPEDYRVYETKQKRLREWTPEDGSIIPQRIVQAIRWRGRVLCFTSDDAHILYGSAYANGFDFATGGDVVTATQAFAGTTAAAGSIPDPLVCLMAASDDLCYVGTTRSVWRLTGDPQTGGQLDDFLATEGVLSRDAHCRGDGGELYWITTSGRVVRMVGNGIEDISSSMIRGRIRRIDQAAVDVQLVWSQAERGLYVVQSARSGSDGVHVEHLFWSARTGRWHPVGFSGGPGRRLTSAAITQAPEAGGWGVAFGFADGGLRYVHPGALDDDGVPIEWRVRMPIGGDGDRQRSLITHAEIVLAPDQGACMAVGVTGRTGQNPDDYGAETQVVPGRGDFTPLQISGPHTWLQLHGAGDPVAVDHISIEVFPWGAN